MISENKLLTAGFILLLSIGFSGWYYVRLLDPVENASQKHFTYPDLILQNVYLENFDREGNRTGNLNTESVNYFIKKQEGEMQKPRLSYQQDKQAPWFIEADIARANQQNRRIQLTGHIFIKQGNNIINADHADASVNDKTLDYAILYGNKQERAYFQTTLPKDNSQLNIKADKITVEMQKDRILFEGHAAIQQGKNTFQAEKIIYHIKEQRLETPEIKNQRTVIRFFPDKSMPALIPQRPLT